MHCDIWKVHPLKKKNMQFTLQTASSHSKSISGHCRPSPEKVTVSDHPVHVTNKRSTSIKQALYALYVFSHLWENNYKSTLKLTCFLKACNIYRQKQLTTPKNQERNLSVKELAET